MTRSDPLDAGEDGPRPLEPLEVASAAVHQVADQLGVRVDPVAVAALAGWLLGALAGRTWAEAERAGLEAAGRVRDLQAADELGRARR